jgi:hypothetical protein
VCAVVLPSTYSLLPRRFKGELFGLGSNHTKYKSKTYGQNNGSNGSNGAQQQQQLQYSTSVHYGTGGMSGHNQTMAPGNFTYDEGY